MATPAMFIHKLCGDRGLTSGWVSKYGFMPDPGPTPQKCIGFYDYGRISHGRYQQDGTLYYHSLVQIITRGLYEEAHDLLHTITNDLSSISRANAIQITVGVVPLTSKARFDSFVYRSGPLHLGRMEKFDFHEFSLNAAVSLHPVFSL